MTPQQIILDLKSKGERNIVFKEDGVITSMHGKHTVNYWIVQSGCLYCFDCESVY